ncbi:Gfo/Idh/MocA family protein [Lederbergia citrea]|uniref:Gfo/Idh/MocA family protein n=1 Tax=Lederbergia citrea TaxID=2833581 RepID=UPI001BC907B8|nr:Gfo/Idh/MocA family oxidoreductase [Lederbergia citrea]MBS4179007.1 Gfo/Idh/MocA family oxidoreductase [Lederbergia citrea]
MKIGIISFAHMHAYSYAQAINRHQDATLVGIADDVKDRGERMAAEFQTIWYADYHEMLQTDIDAVIICSENARHAEMAIAAAKAGKHILCEKPIATNPGEAHAMIEAAKGNDVQLMIAFPCRFHAVAQEIKERIDSGEFGQILAMNGTNRGSNPGGWFVEPEQAGGGAVMDHTVHVVDVMRWFMPGAEVKEVYAEVDTRFHDVPSDDCGLLTFEFDNGVIASLDPSWSRSKSFPVWGDLTVEVVGTKGIARVDLYKENITLHSDDTMKTTWEFWGSDADQGLIDSFIKSVKENTPVLVTGEDGLRAMEVALAAYSSAKKLQPVKVSESVLL